MQGPDEETEARGQQAGIDLVMCIKSYLYSL
jgi:hypothetical protein